MFTEFKPAHGRFIRGIDKSGNKIDPEGKRSPGKLQSDSTKLPNNIAISSEGSHSHPISQIRRSFVDGNKRANGEEWSTPGMFNGAHATTDPSGTHTYTLSALLRYRSAAPITAS